MIHKDFCELGKTLTFSKIITVAVADLSGLAPFDLESENCLLDVPCWSCLALMQ